MKINNFALLVGAFGASTVFQAMVSDNIIRTAASFRFVAQRTTTSDIGYDQRGNDKYFNESMKDVFQMSRALTAREVKWLYKSGKVFPQS
jgi:hypothetical protein